MKSKSQLLPTAGQMGVASLMSVNTAFIDGLRRVAKPVERNPNYRDILGERVDRIIEKHAASGTGELILPNEALAILDRVLQQKQLSKFLMPPAVALAYGKTQNNLREFAFLRAFLARNCLDDKLFNTGLIAPVATGIRIANAGTMLGEVRHSFLEYAVRCKGISRPVLFQLISYVQAYMSWRWSFETTETRLPRVVVLANDHSPAQVACSMVAMEFGIPRIYVQHAEVSDSFPDLNFEVSILRNNASKRIYENTGSVSGKVFVASRENTDFAPLALAPSAHSKAHVCVYLTAQVEWEHLRSVLERLMLNNRVQTVSVKPHPSISIDKVRSVCPPGVTVRTDIPETAHIAVVANSSVVIELIHRGIPTFQFYGLDTVPDDYYGFSRQGIAPRLEPEHFDGDFWSDFAITDEWLAAYAQYNPRADKGREAEEQRLRDALRVFFMRNGREQDASGIGPANEAHFQDWSSAGFARMALSRLPQTVIAAVNNGNEEKLCGVSVDTSLEKRPLIAAFESLFAERSSVIHDLFLLASRISSIRSNFVHWVRRRDTELSGRPISERQLDELCNFVCSERHDSETRKSHEIAMLLFLVRLKRVDKMRAFVPQIRELRFDRIHINHRIGIKKWLQGEPLIWSIFDFNPVNFYNGLSRFHQLKLKVLSIPERASGGAFWSHQQIEKEFLLTAPDSIRSDYERCVAPIYDRLRERMAYMDVRWSEEQRNRFFEQVTAALVSKTPFSMIRLSDGEGYVFGGKFGFFTEDDMRKRERHWWKEELPLELRARILPKLVSASRKADVLGIPCIYRFLRDCADNSTTLLGNTPSRGLIEVLAGVSQFKSATQLLAEEKCNLPLFADLAKMQDLAKVASRLVVVASAAPDRVASLFPDVADIVYISIPTHARTMGNEKYGAVTRSLPHVFGQIRKQITKTVEPGDLVLVAAGVIGKIFVDDAKTAGGVVLDIGSSLDEWVEAGIHSLH